MRIHVVSLPHTQTTREYVWCAYTEKVRKFCNMMYDLGHEVYLYAGERNDARCTEHISVIRPIEIETWWPDWDSETQVWEGWDPEAVWWRVMNARALTAIRERAQPHDFLGIIAGRAQYPLVKNLPGLMPVEWGVGYEGITSVAHHVYESRAWQHYVQGTTKDDNGRFYDDVIPNSFEVEDFSYSRRKDDYLLFIGRMNPRKGLAIVEELAKHHRVITAGQGDLRVVGAEHVGIVRGAEKADLLANARALIAPTLYLEPFGGVAVEAMMSGTPAITTDWGAFPETVVQGETGFRCHNLREFRWAVEHADDLKPRKIRAHAVKNYSTEQVALQYDKYFRRLEDLFGGGWYT